MSRLLFRGTKTFWKTKSSLELAIVEYSKDNIYEIIAFDPVLRKHAPRLYIDACGVYAVIGRNTSRDRNDHMFNDGAVTTFLFNHISIVEYLPTSKSIKIDVRAIFHDEICAHNSPLVIERPEGLSFFASPFAINNSDRNGEDSFMFVFGRVRQLQIPLLDKWRLPLILVRVSKSLPLRESDEKIWACFVHNKTQEELLVTIASALARQVPSTRLPSIQRGAGSQSGTVTTTPRTLSGSLSASLSVSGHSTPNRSRCSSTTKAADLTVPIATTTATTTTTTSTAVDSVVSPQPLRRCSSKLGLPPLKPSPQSQVSKSQNASPLPSTSTLVPQATAGTSQSFSSLDHMCATMGSRTTLIPLVSRSAPSSPQQHTTEITFDAAELSEDSERILNRTYGTVGNTNRRLTVIQSSTNLTLERMHRNSNTTITITTAPATVDPRPVPHHQQHYNTFSSLSQWAAGLLHRRTSSPQDVQTQQSTALHTTEKQNRKG